MVLTVEECLRRIKTSLGTGPGGSAAPDALGIINEAGRHFANMHPWSFYEDGQAYLDRRAKVTLTDGIWTDASLKFTSATVSTAGTYVFVTGDYVQVTSTGDTSTAVLGYYEIANQIAAGIGNYQMIDDTLATGDETVIAATIHTNTVALPSDFKHILALTTSDGLSDSIRETTVDHIIQARAHSFADTQDTLYALTYKRDRTALTVGAAGDKGGAPVPVLDIWPTPTSNETAAYLLYYRRQWADVSGSSDFISIPDWMQPLYLQVLQAFALGIEEHDVAVVDRRLAEIEAGSTFKKAVHTDGLGQQVFGPLRHGALAKAGYDGFWDAAWSFSSTSNPS
jgi:hypothetical protein